MNLFLPICREVRCGGGGPYQALIVCSDLNYRIDLPDAEVRQLISEAPKNGHEDLLAYDQVCRS